MAEACVTKLKGLININYLNENYANKAYCVPVIRGSDQKPPKMVSQLQNQRCLSGVDHVLMGQEMGWNRKI